MADVQARREARRRKILQNCENRLKLITGEHNGSIQEKNNVSTKIQLNCNTKEQDDITENLLKLVNHTHYLKHPATFENHVLQPQQIRKTSNHELEQELPSSSITKYATLCLVLLAVLSRLLVSLEIQFTAQVLLPFFLLESAVLFFNGRSASANDSNNFSMLNMLLLLSNFPTKRLRNMLQMMQSIEGIARDFAVYFFTFVFVHVSLENVF
ncbi:hypothetical protein CBL_13292 [Carabus blaptoides fortunei]